MTTRLGLAAIVLVGLAVLLWWQHGRRERAEARQAVIVEGTAAMKALNQADATFPDQLREQMAAVAVDAAVRPLAAGDTLEAKVLPMFDAYLVTIDRAVAAADRVLAIHPDPDVAKNVELIRARAATVRTMRGALAKLRERIAAGAT